MKTNRIHSLIKIPKRCLICNKKNFYNGKNSSKKRLTHYQCLNCTKNNNRFNYNAQFGSEFAFLSIGYNYYLDSSSYYINFNTYGYKKFNIILAYYSFYNKHKIYSLENVSYVDFRKVQIQDLLKIIEKHRRNLIFL